MKEENERKIVLTKPLTIDSESDSDAYKAPNLMQRILSLFKNVRPGSDLTRFQVLLHFLSRLFLLSGMYLNLFNRKSRPISQFEIPLCL